MSGDHSPVLVVGAGIAGLGAARRLVDAGCPAVVVEARDRIGGRLHTVDLGAATVDMGGAWIHGPEGNPVAALAAEAGVTGTSTAWHRDPNRLLVSDTGGALVNPAPFSRGASAFWQRLQAAIPRPGGNGPGVSVSEAVARGLVPRHGLTPAELVGFDHAAQVSVQSLEADDAERVSFDELVLEARPGGDLLLTGGGYRGLVEHLARDLDVRSGQPVERVEVRPDGVTLRGPGGVLSGPAVIVTVPLPVLLGGIAFDPPLPPEVRDVAGVVGMGRVEKLALRFPARAWADEVASIAVVGTEPDHPFPAWTVHPHEPVLVSYCGGRRARRFARTHPDTLLAQALAGLRTVLPGLGRPEAVVASSWTTDRWSRGSYSYNARPGASVARGRLGQPVSGRLVVAGEATTVDDYGTTHGALASGWRAADQVLDALG